ncbi:MAG: polysaccharide deacetylase family protein [Solirubrobacteraceae bacterium]
MNTAERAARAQVRGGGSPRSRLRGLAALRTPVTVGLLALALAGCGGSSSSSDVKQAKTSAGAGDAARGGIGGTRNAPAQAGSGVGAGAGGSSVAGSGGLSSTAHIGNGPSPTGARSSATVPILMYHVINPPPAGAPFPGLYVTREELQAQVDALAKAGFHAVTMDQMLAAWRGYRSLPSKPVVLSFDNGYQSQYTNALPVLRSVGWAGVENIQLTGLPPSQGGMSEDQVRGLVAAGWELDTQGFSHADLIAITPSELRYQVAVARREVQRRYHVATNWFCYPSGHYNATVIAEVKAAGYVGATSVVPGWASPSDDPYRLPRLRVLGGTSPTSLLAQIAAAESATPAPPSYP